MSPTATAEDQARIDLPPAGERRRLRMWAGLTLAQVGQLCGPVSREAVRDWESGGTPSRRHLIAYQSLLAEIAGLIAARHGAER